jgi:hypothetical protein
VGGAHRQFVVDELAKGCKPLMHLFSWLKEDYDELSLVLDGKRKQ